MSEIIKEKGPPKERVVEEWTTFDDFQRAIEQLSPELKLAFVRQKPHEAPATREQRSKIVLQFSSALEFLYTKMERVFSLRPSFTGLGKDKEIHDAFMAEVDTLWRRRQEEHPIPLVYSDELTIEGLRANVARLEIAYAQAKERFVDVSKKMKTMGPKKRQHFWAEQRGYLTEEGERNLLSQLVGARSSLKRLEEEKKRELALRAAVNQYIVMLTGEEYFEVQLRMIGAIHIPSYFEEQRRKILEDVLLEWALTHSKDPSVVKPPKAEETYSRSGSTENFRPVLRRLLSELKRVYPVVRGNPSPANLKHARLLYENSLRLFQR